MSASANLRPGTGGASIRFSRGSDADSIARLIKAAFQVEMPFIEGDRTNAEVIRTYMEKGRFLLAKDSGGLAGCVYVELRGNRGYLGLLGVDPLRQGTGLGRKLMEAAENHFREKGCIAVDLRVISPRTPLFAFYHHLGYTETGTAPFPPEVPTKVPCHFIYMSKSIA